MPLFKLKRNTRIHHSKLEKQGKHMICKKLIGNNTSKTSLNFPIRRHRVSDTIKKKAQSASVLFTEVPEQKGTKFDNKLTGTESRQVKAKTKQGQFQGKKH